LIHWSAPPVRVWSPVPGVFCIFGLVEQLIERHGRAFDVEREEPGPLSELLLLLH
jgi:hypothetical protein